MPNHNTFSIKPIKELIARHISEGIWVDPFSRDTPFKDACITNDLADFNTDFNIEALDFLKLFDDESVDGVLFDPPYSPRQIAECYKGVGRATYFHDTQSSFYGDRKNEVARIVKPGGKVLSFGWNTGGIGKTKGFDLIEILIVPHGGAHNDTLCTVETKTKGQN